MGDGEPRATPVLTRIAGGEMAGRVRAFDWSKTPLGPIETWSPALRLAADIVLAANFPMALRWGPELVLIYNDAYRPALHENHPQALGLLFRDTSPELQASIRALHEDILSGASGGFAFERLPLKVSRDGGKQLAYFTVSYSPVPDDTAPNGVGGVLVTAVEISQSVAAEADLAAARMDLDLAAQAAGMGRWDHRPHLGQRFWDGRARAIFGLPPDEPSSQDTFERLLHPDDLPAVRAAVAAATDPAGPGTINLEYRIHRADDGAPRWVETFGRAFFEGGRCVRFMGVVSDVTERREAIDRLLRQEETLRLAMDAADAGAWDLNIDTGELTWSERCYAIFGVGVGEPVGLDTFKRCVHPGDQARVAEAMRLAQAPTIRADYAIEFRVIGRDDHVERWLNAKGKVFFGDDGKAHRFVGAVVDITDRKRAELHLRLLVNELNHRVKNSLATIQAIAAQSFTGERDLAQAQEAFSSRIVALAQAHDLLTRENWEGAELHDVVARLAELHGAADRFELSGPAVRLSPKTALSLSMALHELATNAMKYGALSTPEGRIRLAWDLAPEPGAARLDLTWTERDGPPVAPPAERGFGSRLIERGLAAELSGSATIAFPPEGVVCRIRALLEA